MKHVISIPKHEKAKETGHIYKHQVWTDERFRIPKAKLGERNDLILAFWHFGISEKVKRRKIKNRKREAKSLGKLIPRGTQTQSKITGVLSQKALPISTTTLSFFFPQLFPNPIWEIWCWLWAPRIGGPGGPWARGKINCLIGWLLSAF